MRVVLDSDVLVHALRIPKREDLYALHEIEKLLRTAKEVYPFAEEDRFIVEFGTLVEAMKRALTI
ncbi:hypothetical protein C5S30_06110 [ANME-1 cluster archaeon GoMg4]|nr:hypothetical protein [ANME-1 cluster archaeon GoMg4]